MVKQLALLGAPTNLGLKPYDDGTARGNREAPRLYREHGIVQRLGARDLGDVAAAPYRDFVRVPGKVRNEDLVVQHVQRIAAAIRDTHDFVLLLGGDCSILLGSLLGFRHRGPLGLAYVDAHTDANTPATTETGGAAGMDLALATGRGDTVLARLADSPLVDEANVVMFGRREGTLEGTAIGDVGCEAIRRDPEGAAVEALGRLAKNDFFIHVDADVLDPAVMPSVDEPVPDGLQAEELAAMLRPLVRHPRALGLELTIYDPGLDPTGRGAARLVDLLADVFR